MYHETEVLLTKNVSTWWMLALHKDTCEQYMKIYLKGNYKITHTQLEAAIYD